MLRRELDRLDRAALAEMAASNVRSRAVKVGQRYISIALANHLLLSSIDEILAVDCILLSLPEHLDPQLFDSAVQLSEI